MAIFIDFENQKLAKFKTNPNLFQSMELVNPKLSLLGMNSFRF